MGSFFILVLIIALSVALASPSIKGRIGEAKLSFLLNRLNQEEYHVVDDLLIPSKNGTTQIDHVVVSPYGIFVIETKNYKGWIFGDEKSKYWTQVIYKRKEKFYNPIHQNFGHIKALESALEGLYDGTFYSIVSFSSKATFKKVTVTSPDVDVINSLQVLQTIKGHNQRVLSNAKIKGILFKLKQLNQGDKESKKQHVNQIQTARHKEQASVSENSCPKCGNQLVKRTGKYGAFLGCSNYPKCRFVSKKAI
ncbi:NERD domain-containing protein [Pontibacillus yanchengensis]|uniref:NERD domain-containing protein n=2 Tax=Pontibacillus yanchengensis TaxID=462910 RepID=A0ACC7VEB4_9BACI|nr:NERD domain-containing protein [Pontibacillus yanchengensis]MYL34319.1 NERD domain-containing protein [Pontibacillus yanchengensis]MYL53788.1 NERD domain-containing protein [Pontibacillus yanchengensis]